MLCNTLPFFPFLGGSTGNGYHKYGETILLLNDVSISKWFNLMYEYIWSRGLEYHTMHTICFYSIQKICHPKYLNIFL